jgi:hypothetical protein
LKIGFVQSKVDEYVFYRDGVVLMVYVDDGICVCINMGKIDQAILELRAAGYDIEDMGDVNDYLGINFESLPGGKVKEVVSASPRRCNFTRLQAYPQ